jgi:hypothetical protein
MPGTTFHTTERLVGEIAAGEGVSLATAARSLPGRQNKSVNPSTLWRWAREGVRIGQGQRVRLEVALCGARYVTSPGAVARFLGTLNAPISEAPEPHRPIDMAKPNPKPNRQREIDRVNADLEKLGL